MRQTWTVVVERDPETGELVIPLPHDLLQAMRWGPGTTLVWEEWIGRDAWILRKQEPHERSTLHP